MDFTKFACVGICGWFWGLNFRWFSSSIGICYCRKLRLVFYIDKWHFIWGSFWFKFQVELVFPFSCLILDLEPECVLIIFQVELILAFAFCILLDKYRESEKRSSSECNTCGRSTHGGRWWWRARYLHKWEADQGGNSSIVSNYHAILKADWSVARSVSCYQHRCQG